MISEVSLLNIKWKETGTHPGIPRTPSASDRGSPDKSGMMNGFDDHSTVGGLSILIILLVCHPKLPTMWIPTLYSGC